MGLSVAADFTAANGRELEGFVSVNLLSRFMAHEGAILYAHKYLYVSSMLSASEQEYVGECVGVSSAELFPLEWVLRAHVEDETGFRRGQFLP